MRTTWNDLDVGMSCTRHQKLQRAQGSEHGWEGESKAKSERVRVDAIDGVLTLDHGRSRVGVGVSLAPWSRGNGSLTE